MRRPLLRVVIVIAVCPVALTAQQQNCRSYWVGTARYAACDPGGLKPASPSVDTSIYQRPQSPPADPMKTLAAAFDHPQQVRALQQQNELAALQLDASRRASSATAHVSALPPPETPQQKSRADGNMWRKLAPETRLIYAAGLLAGARELSWMLVADDFADDDLAKLIVSLSSSAEGITSEQLRDGLDVFCEDYRNRGIDIRSAALVVIRQIKGKPATEIEALLQRLRAAVK